MEEQQLLALALAGVVAPWIVEIFKYFLNTVSEKMKVTISIVISFVISFVVLLISKVDYADPRALFQATMMVFGIATAVYNYLKAQVQEPIRAVLKGVKRPNI